MKLAKRPEIDAYLNRPPTGIAACLIYGKDRALVIERGEALARKIVADPRDPFNVSLISDTDLDGDPGRLEDELSAQSLMGGRRLVRLRFFSEKAGLDKLITAALKTHMEGGFKSETFFLIEAGGLGSDSALRRAADNDKVAASIACYEDEAGDIVRMARETLSQNDVALSNDAMDHFVARLPKERGIARQEIERLCLFIGPGSRKTLSLAELEDFLGVEPEASLFQAAFDAFGGRMKLSQACLRRAYAEGEGGADAVRALEGHYGKLRLVQTLLQQGVGSKEATKSAGIFWKQEAEMLRQVKSWREDLLDPLAGELVETDKQCKSTGMPDQLIAERLYLTIAARARRAGL
jgi:DNA polymerase III subunit delta